MIGCLLIDSGSIPGETVMNTKDKGNIGEAKAITYLLENGYAVLIPFGDNTQYDVVAEKNNKFTRIQIKFVSISKGILRIPLYRCTSKNGKQVMKKYTPANVDEIWAYCPDNNNLYRIPISNCCGNANIYILRIKQPKYTYKDNRIKYAADYML